MNALEAGGVVKVRSRQYLVEEVTPPERAGEDTRVKLSCLDDDAQGQRIEVLWESEVDAEILTATSFSGALSKGFDDPRRFAAWLHTQRWNCVTATDPGLFQSPHRAGIEVMAYQLEPLRKALRLPRVNLFIADDVGLGKTIEAGLVIRELLLRQKVRRVVVTCPASVVWQWKNELESRFGLSFAVIDRDYWRRCRQERGFGVNPWKTHTSFIISHNLLRDEEYSDSLRGWMEDKKPFSGSLLILDEAHNAAPASGSRYAIDSKLTRTVRELSNHFEHRLFLSATPHNGHSNSFSALLEMLDPQRFCRGVPVRSPKLLDDVMVRRLKADLRATGGTFPIRRVVQLDIDKLQSDCVELQLPVLLDGYRKLREQTLKAAQATKKQSAAGLLVVTSLQKRLLSSIDAFARTLKAHRASATKKHQQAQLEDPQFLLLARPPGADDEELAELSGDELQAAEDAEVDLATRVSGAFSAEEVKLLDQMASLAESARHEADSKVKRLVEWLKENCLVNGRWVETRVLIFTEYVDTLRYLRKQLELVLPDVEGRIDVFEGGSVLSKRREELKEAFNADPYTNRLRVLIATDAAREGVNLQNHCADLFHFDIPWNPGRMEQRNGRIDRKHQRQKEVRCHYFFYAQRAADRVLQVLVEKSETIQGELGSLSQVVDVKLAKRLAAGIPLDAVDQLREAVREEGPGDQQAVVKEELDGARSAKLEEELTRLRKMLEESKKHLGFSTEALRLALNESLSLMQAPELSGGDVGPNGKEIWAVPDLREVESTGPQWLETIDTLRRPRKPGQRLWGWRKENPPRPVVFEDVGTLDDETVHLHLEQKLVQRLLGRFLSQGFVHDELSRCCALLTKSAVPKVVLVGRLALHGEGAVRLHDELIHVTAPWLESSQRKSGGLKAYQTTQERLTLTELDSLLSDEKAKQPAEAVLKKLRTTLEADLASLEPELRKRAAEADEAARHALADRAEKEAKSLHDLLVAQQKRIRETLEAPKQAELQFTEDEKRQAQAEATHQRKRLEAIKDELVQEPARVRATYAVHAQRIEVLGVIYLWPVTG